MKCIGKCMYFSNVFLVMHLVMYFTVNLAFVIHFENAIENLGSSILTNWTTQEQILPISVESFEFYPKLLST